MLPAARKTRLLHLFLFSFWYAGGRHWGRWKRKDLGSFSPCFPMISDKRRKDRILFGIKRNGWVSVCSLDSFPFRHFITPDVFLDIDVFLMRGMLLLSPLDKATKTGLSMTSNWIAFQLLNTCLTHFPGLCMYEVLMLCKHSSALIILLIITITSHQDRFYFHGYLSYQTWSPFLIH